MSEPHSGAGGGSDLKVPILFGSVIALLGANVYLYTQLDGVKTDLAEFRRRTESEIANVKESSTVSTQTARRTLTTLKDELETARRQGAMAAGQARVEAEKHAEELAKKLAAEQRRQDREAQQIKTDLTRAVSDVASNANTKLSEFSAEVGTVKTEVANARTELERTIADLKRVTGDLGVQSGLIATNSKELDALRAVGERNYVQFDIKRTKEPQRVGDVSISLRKADTKRNRYTIQLLADDKTVEKKDRSINEPVQFYVSKSRIPYELVVNEVRKNQIVGYLATPKLQAARN